MLAGLLPGAVPATELSCSSCSGVGSVTGWIRGGSADRRPTGRALTMGSLSSGQAGPARVVGEPGRPHPANDCAHARIVSRQEALLLVLSSSAGCREG